MAAITLRIEDHIHIGSYIVHYTITSAEWSIASFWALQQLLSYILLSVLSPHTLYGSMKGIFSWGWPTLTNVVIINWWKRASKTFLHKLICLVLLDPVFKYPYFTLYPWRYYRTEENSLISAVTDCVLLYLLYMNLLLWVDGNGLSFVKVSETSICSCHFVQFMLLSKTHLKVSLKTLRIVQIKSKRPN